VLCWSVDRISRSMTDLLSFLGELKAKGVDLFLHQQNLDSSTPSGRAMFLLSGIFSELETAILKERIHAGLNRARQNGVRLGRPSVWNTPQVINSVKLLREKQMPIHQIAKSLKIGVGTVSKILAAA
jgi:DNA invertase Pin-like site-specific DNA recombinase